MTPVTKQELRSMIEEREACPIYFGKEGKREHDIELLALKRWLIELTENPPGAHKQRKKQNGGFQL